MSLARVPDTPPGFCRKCGRPLTKRPRVVQEYDRESGEAVYREVARCRKRGHTLVVRRYGGKVLLQGWHEP